MRASTAPPQVQQWTPEPGPAAGFWKQKKLIIAVAVLVLALAYLITVGVMNSAMFYLTVDELLAKGPAATGERLRVGGTVAQDSVHSVSGTLTTHFNVTSAQKGLPVAYTGVVPDAFQPGGEVVLEGALTPEGTFNADVLLAKCPSKYLPAV